MKNVINFLLDIAAILMAVAMFAFIAMESIAKYIAKTFDYAAERMEYFIRKIDNYGIKD